MAERDAGIAVDTNTAAVRTAGATVAVRAAVGGRPTSSRRLRLNFLLRAEIERRRVAGVVPPQADRRREPERHHSQNELSAHTQRGEPAGAGG